MIPKLGQNFIKNKKFINKIINSINPHKNDYFLEIGSGYGAITFPFIKKNIFNKLLLIEIDKNLFFYLKKFFLSYKIIIINNNILKINLYKLCLIFKIFKIRIIGNLPFYISKKLLLYFIKYINVINNIIILLQQEVGNKLISKPGKKTYCKLTILIQFYFTIKILLKIPASCFIPKPKVNASLILLIPKKISKIIYYTQIIIVFYKIINLSFIHKRKTLLNCLKQIINKYYFILLGFNLKIRPNNLSIKDYFYLSYCIFILNLIKIKKIKN